MHQHNGANHVEREFNQQEAAYRMGIAQPKVSGLLHGDFTNLSERKLMECLNRLGYDIRDFTDFPTADMSDLLFASHPT
jgi:predicted XRE-type DNA-binding protein